MHSNMKIIGARRACSFSPAFLSFALLAGRRSFAARHAGQSLGIFRNGFGDRAIVNALAFPSAFNKAGIRENFKMMGNGSGGDTAEGDKVTADHLFVGGDGFKDHEAGGIRQSL
jgi:hypothetical protein